jgi:glycosyltransferase involved in cell wall biosynthesis
MREHDVLLLPSLRTDGWEELFGMVIIEAMACGVVPITTDHVGPREILLRIPCVIFKENEYVERVTDFLRKINMDRSRTEVLKIVERYKIDSISDRWGLLLSE